LFHLWLIGGALTRFISRGPSVNDRWVFDSPVHSDVEAKLRQHLIELGNNDKILGIQVHVAFVNPWYT
jgi:aarF domain-containing kinase